MVSGADRIGGVVGNAGSYIKSSYNTGAVSGETSYAGSLIGYKTSSSAVGTPCFWLEGSAEKAVGYGTQTPAPVMDTSETLKTKAADLGDAWTDAHGDENGGYPVLKAFSYITGFRLSAPGAETGDAIDQRIKTGTIPTTLTRGAVHFRIT
jgi:hypothetical protein